MKNFSGRNAKLVKQLFIATIVLCAIYFLTPLIANYAAKSIISSKINQEGFKVKDLYITVSSSKIKIKKAKISIFNADIDLAYSEIKYNLLDIFTHKDSNFTLDNVPIRINNVESGRLSLHGEYNFSSRMLKLVPDIKLTNNIEGSQVRNLDITGAIKAEGKWINFEDLAIKINDAKVNINGQAKYTGSDFFKINIKAEVSNLPLMLYKTVLSDKNGIYRFFEESIENGEIKSAMINLDIPEEFFKIAKAGKYKGLDKVFKKEYANGSFIITNFAYKYSPYMPQIKSNDLQLDIEGANININLKNAKIAKTTVKDGIVKFNYLADDIVIYADANAEGDTQTLISFINPDSLKKMDESGITLGDFVGNSKTKIYIEIPLKEGIENKYLVKTKISNLAAKILHDRLDLKGFNIDGEFNGHNVYLNGKGSINGLASQVDMAVNLDEKAEITHKLNAKLFITQSDNEIAGVKFLDGSSVLKLELVGRNDNMEISAKGNLKNVHFLIPAIALDKQIGKAANFVLTSTLQQGKKQTLSVSLVGDDNLKIIGQINTDEKNAEILFSKVEHLNNSFKAHVITSQNKLIANISGDRIDLSAADFSKALRQNSSLADVKLIMTLDTVKMKNNIVFTSTMIDLECVNKICPVAKFSADMMGNLLRAEYKHNKEVPRLEVSTNNAGMLFSALGLTNKLKKGRMDLTINKKINQVGIQDYHGTFSIYNFDVTQNKLLTRMVSFISIPGLVGSLINKDIRFDDLQGEFNLNGGVVNFSNISAHGPYFNFFLKGNVYTQERKIELKGQVVPSLYGLNKLMGSIPLIKALFGKKRGGLVFTPFFMNETF